MKKLIEKILEYRGPEYRPFAIEVSEDDIRLSIYGGARGFQDAPTAETASHDNIEGCLLEGIDLLEHSRLLCPNREPYYRRPHHHCVFFRRFSGPGTGRAKRTRVVQLKRRTLLRAIPQVGHVVVFSPGGESFHMARVHGVHWNLERDEVHFLEDVVACASSKDLDQQVSVHLQNGWTMHSETMKSTTNSPTTKKR